MTVTSNPPEATPRPNPPRDDQHRGRNIWWGLIAAVAILAVIGASAAVLLTTNDPRPQVETVVMPPLGQINPATSAPPVITTAPPADYTGCPAGPSASGTSVEQGQALLRMVQAAEELQDRECADAALGHPRGIGVQYVNTVLQLHYIGPGSLRVSDVQVSTASFGDTLWVVTFALGGGPPHYLAASVNNTNPPTIGTIYGVSQDRSQLNLPSG